MIQTTIPRVLNCCWKDPLQEKDNLVLQRWSNRASRKLMRSSLKFRRIQCTVSYSKEDIPIEERKWNDIPAYKHFRGHTFEAEVSKLVRRLVRHLMIKTRETDGSVHWKPPRAKNSRTPIGVNTFMKEATKRGSSIARIPEMSHVHSCYSRTHWWESDSA